MKKFFLFLQTALLAGVIGLRAQECEPMSITPAVQEDFESYTSGTGYNVNNQAPCWTTGNANASAANTYKAYIYKSATYASSGTNSYRMNGNATNSPAWIASPEIACEKLSEVLVTFNMYATTSYWWVCGVMTDPADISTFVVLDSVKGTGASARYYYDLSDYEDIIPSDAKYFAWRTPYGVASTAYLDDVQFEQITCALPKPSAKNITYNSARIYSGMKESLGWHLQVAKVADSVTIVYQGQQDAYNRFKDITGLEENTTYQVNIMSTCDKGSSPQISISFKTPCKPVTPEALGTITFSTDEGYVTGTSASRYLPCWTIGNKSGNAAPTSSYIPSVGTAAAYKHNDLNYLYIYSYVPASATSVSYDGAYAIMQELEVDDISKYQVNFWARTNTGTSAAYHDNLIVGIISDPNDLSTFVPVDTLTLSHTAYEPFTIPFDQYKGGYLGVKGRHIMFTTETGVSGATAYGYAYVSEISVEKIPNCRPVSEFTVDSIGEDMAIISWEQSSAQYRVLLADQEVAEADKATYPWLLDTIVSNTEHVQIRDLRYTTNYYVYAQAICGAEMSSEISMAYAHFMTNCPENGYLLPYYAHFEYSPKTGSGNKPLCWDGVQLTMDTIGAQTYPYVYSSATYAYNSSLCMYMYSYGYWNNAQGKYTSNTKCYAVAPKVDGDLNNLMVRFYARKAGTTTSYGNILEVGYVTDASQEGMISTFVKIADVTIPSATYDQYQVVISDYTESIPMGARIALRADWSAQGFETPTSNSSFYASFYIDNFEITYTPNCFAPKIEVIGTTLYSAELRIIPAKEADHKWQITLWNNELLFEERIITSDSTHVFVGSLEPGTEYWFAARTICDESDISSWSDQEVSARTKYYYDDSYFFGFERSEGWENCQGSTSGTYYLHPALEVGYEGGSASTAYTTYYPYSQENSSSYVYAYGPANTSLGVLRWQASASYWGGYVVFPSVVNPKERSFEFKARSGYLSANTMTPTSSYDARFEIGTIDKNKGFDTYEVLTSAELKKLSADSIGSEENDWLWSSYTIDLDSATIADKQIVIRLPKPEDSNTRYMHFDNVTLGDPKGFGYVSLNKIRTVTDTVNIEWDNTGGPWNLTIWNNELNAIVTQFFNLTTTSMTITNLASNTEFTAILESANAPANTNYQVSSTKTFRTMCPPYIGDNKNEFFWGFDSPDDMVPNDILQGVASDTAYLKPSCFTTATNYTESYSNGNQWLWQSKGYNYYSSLGTPSETNKHREIGYNDSYGSLRVYTTNAYASETVKTWIALPKLNCGLDTMMIEFWGRCFANQDETASSNPGKIVSTTYLGASYSQSLVIGTLTDPRDFSTLQILDTVTYDVPEGISTDTYVSSDTTGNHYWQKMQVPLKGAKGDYIVLFQPAPGLFFVDNLRIKSAYGTLFAPDHTETTAITTEGATLRWEVKHADLPSVVVVKDANEVEVLHQTVPAGITSYTIEKLHPATLYKWYVYQTDNNTESIPSATNEFYTECESIHPSYTNGFELEDGWRLVPGATSDNYKQTLCWTYGNAGTATAWSSSFPYNQANTSSLAYSYSGNSALRLYAYSTTYQGYAAMPAIYDVSAYDTLQVNFRMRPGYHNPNTGKITTQYTVGSTASTADYYYAKSVIVGTMTDPDDVSTFMPIDTITYNGTIASGDDVNAENDYLFQQKSVILTGSKGKHVAFMATLWAKGAENKSTYDYMWIDNISFSGINPCEMPIIEEETNATICEGETYTWNGQTFNTSGTYRHTIQHAGFDCDSAVHVLNLTVKETMFIPVEPATICAGESYNWHGRTLTQSGSYYDTIPSSLGCDSIIEMLTLNVIPQKIMLLFDTICEGDYKMWEGQPLSESGVYTKTLTSMDGCDSTIYMTLTVLPSSRGEEWYTVCENFTWPLNNKTYYESGMYLDTITNAIGCDSIVTLHLTINTPALSHETANMCSGESYVWHGQTYTAAGMYLDTLTAANGCDSICTLKLQVYPNSQTELEVTECGAYTWNGNTYYESGDYQYTTQNMFGCDSIVTLHLTILKAAYERIDHGTITPDQAAGYPFDAPGQYTWNDTVRYSLGCDSVITTHILVIEPYKYAWKVESNDPAMGTILTASADTFYYYGASVTAEAIPNSGYQFVKWNDGKTDNPYRMTMVEDTYLRAIFAAANTTPEETAVTPTSTTATFTWPLIIGGYTYTLTIYLNSEMTIPFCDILFDQFGRFISRIFSAAPARHQMAQNDSFTYTITDLTPKTDYYFQMKASSQDDLLLNTDIGSFKTEDTTTGIDEMVNDQIVNVKVLRDGHLYILHGNKIFTATGQEVR